MNWHEARGIKYRDPDAVKLTLPDIRQTEEYNCGEAAVDTVFSHLGVRSSAAHVLAGGLANPVDGTHPVTMEHALRFAGVKVQSGTMTVDDLKHHTKHGRPVLCCVSLYGGHWVVVAGVVRGRVHFQCPTDGPRSLSVNEWQQVWRDSTRSGHDFDAWGIAVGI